MNNEYYNKDMETLPVDELRRRQILKLSEAVIYASNNSPLYRDVKQIPGNLEFRSALEFSHLIPLTNKNDLLLFPNYLSLAVPQNEVAEVHFSSGTSGVAVPSFLTARDLAMGSEFLARTWYMQGVRSDSVFAMLASYGLFSAGLLNHYAIQQIGALILPIGSAGSTKVLQMIGEYTPNIVASIASYYPYLAALSRQSGIDPRKLGLKTIIAGGEPFSEAEREHVESEFGANMYDQYGLCEINTGLAGECIARDGLHMLADYVYPEIIDPKTGILLDEGSEGELVLTTFYKEASPLLRYRTGDITSITYSPCSCGRTMPRIARIKKRTIDTLFYKGIGVEKPFVEGLLKKLSKEINPHLWQMVIDLHDSRECTVFRVVLNQGMDDDAIMRVREYLSINLGFKVDVISFTSKELSELGEKKLKNFIDKRTHFTNSPSVQHHENK